MTNNSTYYHANYDADGGVVNLSGLSTLHLANNIIAGNSNSGAINFKFSDISGTITSSDGHNIFGSDVPATIRATARTSLPAPSSPASTPTPAAASSAAAVVPLLNNINNPALSGADPLAASATGQNGTSARPQPAGSLPDIGSVEINQPLSTTPRPGTTCSPARPPPTRINGVAGNDYLKGLGGKDTLNGGDGSDLLDGGTGNDKLNGGGGIDLVTFAGSTKVVVRSQRATDTAKRGSETDTLTGIEGAIGSTAADVFKGNGFNNYFQGGLGKDTFTGGSGRDLYDFNAVAESGVGTTGAT